MAFSPNEYRKKAYNEQLAAIDEAYKQYQIQADRSMEIAKQTQLGEDKNARVDYYNLLNPYGVEADVMARSGLKNSGLSQSNLVRGYSDYQNRLGAAASAYANTQADVNASMLGYQSQLNAEKIGARSDYYNQLADEYDSYKKKGSIGSGGGGGRNNDPPSVEGMNLNQIYNLYLSTKDPNEKAYYWQQYTKLKSMVGTYRDQF
jgi:hypothetical protein